METPLDTYIAERIDQEPDLLRALYRETHVKLLRPRMLSGHVQGRLLKMFVRMIQPKTILELGTFAGYSALCMAEALGEGCVVHTIDIDDELESFARKYFDQSPDRDKIRFHIGDALAIIPTLDDVFDLVFIDADKRQYTAYYEAVLPKVRPGGFILADNTLWDGKVVQPVASNDHHTKEILAFNDHVAADPRVEKVILPIRDGLTILYKKN